MTIKHPDSAGFVAGPDPIAALHAGLVADLAATLDLAAGVTDAIQPHHLTNLAADLHDALDLAAGLAAIGAAEPKPRHFSVSARPSTSTTSAGDLDRPLQRRAADLADRLGALDPPTRLSLRTHPQFRRLHISLQLASDLNRANDLALSLVHYRGGTRDVARDTAAAVDRAVRRARALAPDLARDRAIDLALDLACALARDRDLASTSGDRLARRIARTVAEVLADVRRGSLELADQVARNLVSDDANPDGTSADDPLAEMLAFALLETVVNDFAGADLRWAALDDAVLTGIRWSKTTLWPPDWENRIRAASTEIEPGTFEVAEDGPKRRSLTGAT